MTRPIRVISRRDRLARWTVWHPIHTDPADENRWGPRFWYPTYDLLALSLGIYAYFLGSPLLNQLFSTWFTDTMGILLIVSSVICLVGVCFPKLNIFELIGKLLIVFILSSYAGTVMFMSGSNEPNGFVVITLVMSVWLLGPRVSVLFAQVIKTRSERKKAKAEQWTKPHGYQEP